MENAKKTNEKLQIPFFISIWKKRVVGYNSTRYKSMVAKGMALL